MIINPIRTVCLVLLAAALPFHAEAATYTVSNKNDSGAGSLRQAILDANSSTGPDTIAFAITGATPYNIAPASALPTISEPTLIDGTTQSGYAGQPLVAIVGSSAGANVNGLVLLTSNCEVRALAINRFDGNGIQINGSGNVVAGCFIGTSLAGVLKLGNSAAGVTIVNGANNRIGGNTSSDANLISGNGTGIYITGLNASNNVVIGNLIGTDVNGTSALGNDAVGVLLSAPRNLIGGTSPVERNVISGNGGSGVYLNDVGATGNRVIGNYIGLKANGAAALSNGVDGVTIYRARDNIIGGATAGEGNVISANNERGVFLIGSGAAQNRIEGNLIGTDAAGRSILGNRYTGVGISSGSSNSVGGLAAGARNVIAGNQQSGVAIDSNSVANVVSGNFIGLDITGTNALPNAWSGVSVLQGTSNVIGGTLAGAGNVISGNAQYGIVLSGGVATMIQGNLIGTDSGGRLARGNVLSGVRIDCASNWIGGEALPARNVISGNGNSGILLSGMHASNNVIAGNFIGPDVTGAARIGNGFAGINLAGAPGNWIGTAAPRGGNVISGNGFLGAGFSGLYLNGAGATGNWVRGNLIGTDATGTNAMANAVGGIIVSGAGTNLFGGSEPGAGNVISGNLKVAVSIGDPGANGNVLIGNLIGTMPDGTTPLGNQWHGIEFLNTASGNVVGGIAPGEGNRIAYATSPAGYDGVRIRDGCSNNVVRGNAIFDNPGLAIDLGVDGATLNDAGDADAGANALQNFPVLSSASGRFLTTIAGSLNSRPNSACTIDFYGNTAADPTGYGEGQRYLGSINVMTGGDGNATFTTTLTNAVNVGSFISATATDAAKNTSEFSAVVAVDPSIDSDGDGLVDDYEIAFGLNPNSAVDRDLDADGDGAGNFEEFLAGTRANDRSSVFQITLVKEPGDTLILVNTVPGMTYRVDGATDVTGPWTVLVDNVAGTGMPLRVVDVPATGTKFYRASAKQ